jgi:Raf kinase inhibitor-like YbhB/YbcL family protein
MSMTLTSTSFAEGQHIPTRHTCEGTNTPPPLSWSRSPEEVRSFVLIMDDPDVPGEPFTHWVLFDIPAGTRSVGGEAPVVGIGGRNDHQHERYAGPCPPPNRGAHRYFFRLYALDIESLGLPAGAHRREVEKAMDGHVIRRAELMCQFQRGAGER